MVRATDSQTEGRDKDIGKPLFGAGSVMATKAFHPKPETAVTGRVSGFRATP
jgi:hypothetical protein